MRRCMRLVREICTRAEAKITATILRLISRDISKRSCRASCSSVLYFVGFVGVLCHYVYASPVDARRNTARELEVRELLPRQLQTRESEHKLVLTCSP